VWLFFRGREVCPRKDFTNTHAQTITTCLRTRQDSEDSIASDDYDNDGPEQRLTQTSILAASDALFAAEGAGFGGAPPRPISPGHLGEQGGGALWANNPSELLPFMRCWHR